MIHTLLLQEEEYIVESSEVWKSKSSEQIEEWFLSSLSEEKLNLKKVADFLRHLIKAGELTLFKGFAELLQDELKQRDMKKEGIWLLTLRGTVLGVDPSFKLNARKTAETILDSRLGSMFIKNSGFDTDLPVAVCMQRLNLLLSLNEGCYCHEKTWGFGVVNKVDAFYEKVIVDFKNKPGHQFSFKYAAETLELVGDDHLMARYYADPEGVAAMVESDPGEVIKIALRSYGPMSVPLLNELFVKEGIVQESGWKSFWAAARKNLKTDVLVEIPEKRNAPVVLLESERIYDEKWFERLAEQRDVARIIPLIKGLLENVAPDELTDEARSIVGKRLRFVLTAGATVSRGDVVDALLLAHTMKLSEEETGARGFLEKLRDSKVLSGVLNTLTMRQTAELREYLVELYPAEISGVLRACIGELHGPVLNDVMAYLVESDGEECARAVKDLLDEGDSGAALVQWVCRNSSKVIGWGVATPFSLIMLLLDAIGRRGGDVTVASINQLKALLEKGEWFLSTLQKLTKDQRADIVIRIQRSNDWDESGRRAVIARAIKAFPELQSIFDQTARQEADDERPRGNYTSFRSYREKSDQLKRLVNEEIPRNSRDIGIARSYGDLRENGEYEAARHEQGLLMARKAEIETDLARVTATDFSGFPVDRAGMGTHVVISRDDGVEMQFNILGEWDRDESLNIISSRSRVAELLSGAKPGDKISLPTETAEMMCAVKSVEGLDEKVKKWISGKSQANIDIVN